MDPLGQGKWNPAPQDDGQEPQGRWAPLSGTGGSSKRALGLLWVDISGLGIDISIGTIWRKARLQNLQAACCRQLALIEDAAVSGMLGVSCRQDPVYA